MESVRQAVGRERERLFVGRQAELDHLAAWLAESPPPTKVLSIQGMGGIGKSTLLAEMLRRAEADGAKTLLMNGRACVLSPAGFLEYLRTLLNERPDTHLPSLGQLAQRGCRVVLSVDNYDDIRMLEGWLREELLGGFPGHGILVILVSRQGVAPAWLADPAWRGRIEQLTVLPFVRGEVGEYLARLGLTGHPGAKILMRESEGHPLALALAAERMARQADAVPAVAQDIGAHLLREVASPALHPVLETLAILPEADQDLLGAVLDEPLSTDAYYALARLSFVGTSERGLVLHDAARAHLLADLRRRTPGHRHRLRRRAVAALRARLDLAVGRERRRYATQLIAVCRDAFPVHELSDLRTRPDLLVPTAFRPEDRPRLHQILDAWIREACGLTDLDDEHRMLDALCDHLPDSIWIVRSADGECLAFLTQVLLHRETAALLEQYRAGALYLENCSARERDALNCTPEVADTYITMGNFAAMDSTEYSPGELFGMLLHALHMLLVEGLRLVGFANNPGALEQVRSLGFQLRPECSAQFGDAPWPFVVFELDLRERDYGEWVTTLLDTLEPEAPTVAPPDDPAVLDEVREALDALDDPSRMRSLALARRLGRPEGEVVVRVRRLLSADRPPAPLRPEDQEILHSAFPRRYRSREEAAARLHISRATYYRRLRRSLTRLADAMLKGG